MSNNPGLPKMTTYDLYNPTRTPRIIHDGIEGSQRALKLDPGGRLIGVPLHHSVVDLLRSRTGDIEVFVRGIQSKLQPEAQLISPEAIAVKTPVIIDGMWGIGDNLHQRAAIRELMKTNEVWLETCHYLLYHDLVAQGLHLIFKSTRLRAQARTIERERSKFPTSDHPPANARRIKLWYKTDQIKVHGSILKSLLAECEVAPERPDFSLPIPVEWREKARALIAKWNVNDKPIMIYRPIVLRREWNGASRNPDPVAYEALFKAARDKFFVVSIADLKDKEEWIVGPEQNSDIKIHDGSLDFETMAALFKEAAIVFCNAGFAPVLAQAVGTPVIIVYGGRESYKTTQKAGEHLAPTLGIDADRPCDCHTEKHACNKTITLPPAIERVREFSDRYAMQKPKVLIFATTYVDSDARIKLMDQWLELTSAKNPDCDFLIVDSNSPRKPFIDEVKYGTFDKYMGHRSARLLFDFGDNVGHLSRKGKDGWGRAFCKGLQIGIDCGYDYVAHIEGDSLFRLPVMNIVRQMKLDGTKVASIPVRGMKGGEYPLWVETGLMFFSTEYLRGSKLIEKYDWPNRKERPTPEIIVKQILGADLKMMPWKGLRGDKAQVSSQNILGLDLDWVTHCHNDIFVYDKFIEHELGKGVVPVDTKRRGPEMTPQPMVKLNLGCGDNKLEGWENHDAEVDISKKLPYGDDYADFIFCEHCVEHIPYVDAVAFFAECKRVLKPKGVVRITVPSLEQVYKCDDQEYWKFTTKFQPDATRRGAMFNIMFKHGHKTCWTASLLEATLYYVGFDSLLQCETHKSVHPELSGVEGHHKVIGDKFNRIESLSFEATKDEERVAVVVGGSASVTGELELAKALCGSRADYFVVNDMIEKFPGEAIAVTLHPSKLAGWVAARSGGGLRGIWAHRPYEGASNHIEDWGGSGGLFAVKVARKLGYKKILLCGVPMEAEGGHFLRGTKWAACNAFKRAWEARKGEIAPYVRSFSGWTAQMLGVPTADFVR